MNRYRILAAAVVLSLGLTFGATANGQVVITHSPPVLGFPVMGPPVIPAPIIPVTAYRPITYYQPPPTVVYSAPYVSYYQPVTVYSPPVVSTGSTYVTRSFRGYGVFRPRGIYTSTYVQPTVTYSPGVRSSYYRTVIVP